jgi:acetylornithine/N-succinyldiaminopimelate aminotransferase
MSSHIMPTYYYQLPIALERGQGVWVWDTQGNQYLDALTGIAVTSLGHSHPALTAALIDQVQKLLHTSNTYLIPLQTQVADKLCELSHMDQVFFSNSGAEANETALKMTRMWARKKNISEPIVVTLNGSFHGRSLATLAASGNPRIQQGFEPLMPGFLNIDINDLDALHTLAKTTPNIVAVMLEPTQGDGGIHSCSPEFMQGVRALCDEENWLMIADEIQCGIGRTGHWFAHQASHVLPDVMTLAKALGNGVPIGATLARGRACNLFPAGKHGSTFGGNPLACRAALTVLETMCTDHIVENAATVGAYLKHQLQQALANQPGVIAVRGAGLMIGVELNKPCLNIMELGLEHKLLFNITANTIIRVVPPLILTKTEADEIVTRLSRCIQSFMA